MPYAIFHMKYGIWHMAEVTERRNLTMYRSDVVGSLLRPAYLKEAREGHEAGEISAAALKLIKDPGVDQPAELQDRPAANIVTRRETRRQHLYCPLIAARWGSDNHRGRT